MTAPTTAKTTAASAADNPGITRKRAGKRWKYFNERGREISADAEIERLNAIGLPPAYQNAWYSPDPDSPIQATGYDRRGRRQYRYHTEYRAGQEADKFDRCIEFGRRLPKLRAQVEADLAGEPYAKLTVVAAVVRVLDECRIRIGNRAYARANKSFGATTLLRRHMRLGDAEAVFAFIGKSGKAQNVTVTDTRVIAVLTMLVQLPGQAVFQYRNGDDTVCGVTPADVNQYIQQTIGDGFSAKFFRTWHASAGALREALRLATSGQPLTPKDLAVPVSEELGNTPAIARKSYIHPEVIDAALSGDLPDPVRATKWLDTGEKTLLAMHD